MSSEDSSGSVEDHLFKEGEKLLKSFIDNPSVVLDSPWIALIEKMVKELIKLCNDNVDEVLTKQLLQNNDALSLKMIQTKSAVCKNGNEKFSCFKDLQMKAKDSPMLFRFTSFNVIFYGSDCRTINQFLRVLSDTKGSKENFFYSVLNKDLHRFDFDLILSTSEIKNNIIDSVRETFDMVYGANEYTDLTVEVLIHMVKIAIFMLNKDNSKIMMGYNNFGDNNFTLEKMKNRLYSQDLYGYAYLNSTDICPKNDFMEDLLPNKILNDDYLRIDKCKDLMNDFLQDEYIVRTAIVKENNVLVIRDQNRVLEILLGSNMLGSTNEEEEQNPLASTLNTIKRSRDTSNVNTMNVKCAKTAGDHDTVEMDLGSSMDDAGEHDFMRNVPSVLLTKDSPGDSHDSSPREVKRPSLSIRNLPVVDISGTVLHAFHNPTAVSENVNMLASTEYISFLRNLFSPERLTVIFEYIKNLSNIRNAFFKSWKYVGSISEKAVSTIAKGDIDDWFNITCYSEEGSFSWISCDRFVGYRKLNRHCYIDFLLQLGIKPRKFFSQLYYNLRSNGERLKIFKQCYQDGEISLSLLLSTLQCLWTKDDSYSKNKAIVLFKSTGSMDNSYRKKTLYGFDKDNRPKCAVEWWFEISGTSIVRSSPQSLRGDAGELSMSRDECSIHEIRFQRVDEINVAY